MALYNATGFSNVLVKLVTEKKVAEACFGDGAHAFLGMVTKKKDVAGAGTTIPIHYAPNRYSGTFSTAVTNANGHKYGGWTLSGAEMIPHYGIVEIDTLSKELLSKDEGSFLKEADLKAKAALQAIGNGLSSGLFGSGTGVIGTSASATGSSGAVTITLSIAQQAYNFEVGQYIETDAHLYGTADSYGYITAVDPVAGTIGYTVSSGTLGGTDYIWNQGNEPTASGYAYYKAISGLEGWVPSSTPASTAWFGQDRSGHPRLGGLHLTGTSYTVKEAVMRGLTMCVTAGARGPFVVLCHPDQWNVLAMALEGSSTISKVYPTGFDGSEIKTSVGFSAINFVSPGGDAQVIADKDCLPSVIYVGPKDNAEMHFTPSGIHLIDGDIPIYNSDGRQFRFGCFANFVVPVPGHWCRIAVNAP